MNKNYFKDCTSREEAKKLYKKLAFANHPDKGGNVEIMKEINNQFDDFMTNFKEGKKDTKKQYDFSTSQFKNIINALIRLEGLEIEITGVFLWVTGNTYPNKDAIKSLGFRYSRNKKAWYIAPKEYMENRTSYRKHYSMNDIRNKYGSTRFESEGVDNTKMIG